MDYWGGGGAKGYVGPPLKLLGGAWPPWPLPPLPTPMFLFIYVFTVAAIVKWLERLGYGAESHRKLVS